MAHEVEQMIYCQDTPWHGLGDFLGNIDGVSTEILRDRYPVYFSDLSPAPLICSGQELAEYYGLIRNFDQKLVGHGGKQLIQGVTSPNRVMQCVDNILGTGRAVVHTAGFLRDGSRMWVLCKLTGEQIRVLRLMPIMIW